MNAVQLAKAAEAAAAPLAGILSADILTKVKLAHIAQWLTTQDDSISPATVLLRAQEAIAAIHAGEFASA